MLMSLMMLSMIYVMLTISAESMTPHRARCWMRCRISKAAADTG